jgi:hypothetical protein
LKPAATAARNAATTARQHATNATKNANNLKAGRATKPALG